MNKECGFESGSTDSNTLVSKTLHDLFLLSLSTVCQCAVHLLCKNLDVKAPAAIPLFAKNTLPRRAAAVLQQRALCQKIFIVSRGHCQKIFIVSRGHCQKIFNVSRVLCQKICCASRLHCWKIFYVSTGCTVNKYFKLAGWTFRKYFMLAGCTVNKFLILYYRIPIL